MQSCGVLPELRVRGNTDVAVPVALSSIVCRSGSLGRCRGDPPLHQLPGCRVPDVSRVQSCRPQIQLLVVAGVPEGNKQEVQKPKTQQHHSLDLGLIKNDINHVFCCKEGFKTRFPKITFSYLNVFIKIPFYRGIIRWLKTK